MLSEGDLFGKLEGEPDVVAIEYGEEFSAGVGKGEIAGGTETAVAAARMLKVVDAVGVSGRGLKSYGSGGVDGAVVDDPELPVRIVLGEYGRDGFREECFAVVNRGEDGNERLIRHWPDLFVWQP